MERKNDHPMADITPQKKKKTPKSNCDFCVHYEYDEDAQEMVCAVDLDEDELEQYLSGSFRACPYYQPYDEYKSVQKQN